MAEKKKSIQRQIDSVDHLRAGLDWVDTMAGKALPAGPVLVTLSRLSRTQIQNEKFHAMINDIHRQCFRGYSSDGLKAVLISQFADAKEEMGEPLNNPGETVWDWKARRPVYVRPSSTKFTKQESADFIEFLYAEGTALDVQWSERALEVYEQYREAKK